MIHYHVWFDLKPGVPEHEGLTVIKRFLEDLCATDDVAAFQLLRNRGNAPRSKLPAYHALVQFADDDQFGQAMKKQAARGIHTGAHGDVVDAVTELHVEIFTVIDDSSLLHPVGLYACEI